MENLSDTELRPRDVVTLLGVEIQLRPPASLQTCREVLIAAAHNHPRACVAALALCWPPDRRGQVHTGRPRLTYQQCDYNPLRYGGEFSDLLERQGENWAEVQTAGLLAFLLLADQLPDDEDEENARGN